MLARRVSPLIAVIVAASWLAGGSASNAQTLRYQPSRPTVSPYLNLFRQQTGAIPNYQSLVRPLQLQNEANQRQQQINAERGATISALQAQLFELQQAQAAGAGVSPTGKSSWFFQPSPRQRFMDTSSFYSRAGGAAQRR